MQCSDAEKQRCSKKQKMTEKNIVTDGEMSLKEEKMEGLLGVYSMIA